MAVTTRATSESAFSSDVSNEIKRRRKFLTQPYVCRDACNRCFTPFLTISDNIKFRQTCRLLYSSEVGSLFFSGLVKKITSAIYQTHKSYVGVNGPKLTNPALLKILKVWEEHTTNVQMRHIDTYERPFWRLSSLVHRLHKSFGKYKKETGLGTSFTEKNPEALEDTYRTMCSYISYDHWTGDPTPKRLKDCLRTLWKNYHQHKTKEEIQKKFSNMQKINLFEYSPVSCREELLELFKLHEKLPKRPRKSDITVTTHHASLSLTQSCIPSYLKKLCFHNVENNTPINTGDLTEISFFNAKEISNLTINPNLRNFQLNNTHKTPSSLQFSIDRLTTNKLLSFKLTGTKEFPISWSTTRTHGIDPKKTTYWSCISKILKLEHVSLGGNAAQFIHDFTQADCSKLTVKMNDVQNLGKKLVFGENCKATYINVYLKEGVSVEEIHIESKHTKNVTISTDNAIKVITTFQPKSPTITVRVGKDIYGD